MILLNGTTDSLEVVTGTAQGVDYVITYAQMHSTAAPLQTVQGKIAAAATTPVLAATLNRRWRRVTLATFRNTGSSSQTIRVQKDVSGTDYYLTPTITLAAGECLNYIEGTGWVTLDISGRAKTAPSENSGYNGIAFPFYKVGTVAEAQGVWYCHSKDTGFPGAWSPGVPGVTGRATDGTAAADNGCFPIKNPGSGANYLTSFQAAMNIAGFLMPVDILWVNTGLVVTTVGAQAVNSVTLPARDQEGTTNGLGVMAGILVTAATTNAGAITNTTLDYTDSDGNPGNTGTMASFPATAVIGTLVPFQLAAGDKGVQSIQNITLGTSYVAGSISLVMFRLLGGVSINANSGGPMFQPGNPGVRLYNGVCIVPVLIPGSTTASTPSGVLTVMER